MTAVDGRKGRRLSSEDVALWEGVTRSVRPMRKRAPRAEVAPEPEKVAKSHANKPPAKKPVKRVAAAEPPPAAKPKAPPPVGALDRKLKQKIARGNESIDGRLDLHGHTQAEAHDALLHFLRRTQLRGGRVVLVITGKGVRGAGSGVLKRAVPMWLALPEFRELVIGFDAAAVSHGGEGALYVRVRKVR